ncbi:MAG: hypothetical protein EP297_05390 [Gammaproteobacteria bacterium]|nr:MAG: hypothetical protein EP297_05390 [Gammaproteobacteria bacterium]
MKISPSVILLVLANLIPLAGILWLGWEVLPVMVLFWMENIIIGIYNIPRILLASADEAERLGTKLGTAGFFAVHYGLFTMVHGIFVFEMFGENYLQGRELSVELLVRLVMDFQLYWAIIALFVSHGFSLVMNYLLGGEHHAVTTRQMMKKPYDRVVILHVGILAGGFILQMLSEPLAGLVVLIMLKIFFDVRSHQKEHKGIDYMETGQYADPS